MLETPLTTKLTVRRYFDAILGPETYQVSVRHTGAFLGVVHRYAGNPTLEMPACWLATCKEGETYSLAEFPTSREAMAYVAGLIGDHHAL